MISPYFDGPMETGGGITAKYFCPLLKIASRLVLFSSLCFLFPVAHSQTTNISGIVNSYYQVVEIIPAKAAIRVSNIAGLNMNDKVMIIQMKGASVNTSINSGFGDITGGLNNSGKYDIGTICSLTGDTAFVFFSMENQYTVAEKVQLVNFVENSSA